MIESVLIVKSIVIKQLKLKYKQSMLGFLWSLITPLAFLMIFNFVFSTAFKTIDNYSLYVLTGLIFWQFFSNATNQTIQCFLQNASIIKTINIPIELFPISAITTELIGLVISFIPFTFVMIFFGFHLSWHVLLVIPTVFLFSVTAYGLGVLLGVLNVYLRDISILWTTLNPALFYLTPIAYDTTIIPSKYLYLLQFNPLYHFFDVFRSILYRNELPSVRSMVIISVIALVSYLISKLTFLKLEKGIISNI